MEKHQDGAAREADAGARTARKKVGAGGRRADKARRTKLGREARPRRVSAEEIAREAWKRALKGDATFLDVIVAAGILIQSVAENGNMSDAALADALLRHIAKKSDEKP